MCVVGMPGSGSDRPGSGADEDEDEEDQNVIPSSVTRPRRGVRWRGPADCGTLLVMSVLLLTPSRAAATTDAWSAGDWALGVGLPLLLVAVGVVLYVRGRAASAEATRVRAGFGGPPGTHDVATGQGLGVEDDRARRLAAQRLRLWGLLLVLAGMVWLLVASVVALL